MLHQPQAQHPAHLAPSTPEAPSAASSPLQPLALQEPGAQHPAHFSPCRSFSPELSSPPSCITEGRGRGRKPDHPRGPTATSSSPVCGVRKGRSSRPRTCSAHVTPAMPPPTTTNGPTDRAASMFPGGWQPTGHRRPVTCEPSSTRKGSSPHSHFRRLGSTDSGLRMPGSFILIPFEYLPRNLHLKVWTCRSLPGFYNCYYTHILNSLW